MRESSSATRARWKSSDPTARRKCMVFALSSAHVHVMGPHSRAGAPAPSASLSFDGQDEGPVASSSADVAIVFNVRERSMRRSRPFWRLRRFLSGGVPWRSAFAEAAPMGRLFVLGILRTSGVAPIALQQPRTARVRFGD
jgi:hypothetical protein